MGDWMNFFSSCKLVDLSHRLEEQMPVPDDLSRYAHTLWADLERGDGCCCYQCLMNEHTGTHVDAPAHVVPRDSPLFTAVDQMPLEQFFFPCAVIPVRPGPKGAVQPEDILAWEKTNGPLRQGEGAFFHTGWDIYWDALPAGRAFLTDWPGLSAAAAFLLLERGVAAVGTDCLSIDPAGATGLPVHSILLERQVPIYENLANLGMIPGRCFVLAPPLPIQNGSGSPVRVVALG